MRISRRTDQLHCLCDKALSFPLSEFRKEELEQLEKRALLTSAGGDYELRRRLEWCRLTLEQLRMCGFPLSQQQVKLAAAAADEDTERPAKRAKVSDEEDDGGALDEQTAEAMLQLLRDRFRVGVAVSVPSKCVGDAGLYRPPRGFVDTQSPAVLAEMAT